jgi:hypothetical protein
LRVGESRRVRGEAGKGFDVARSGRRADLLVGKIKRRGGLSTAACDRRWIRNVGEEGDIWP